MMYGKFLNAASLMALAVALAGCNGVDGSTSNVRGGSSGGGTGVKLVAIDENLTPILVPGEEMSEGGVSDGGTTIIDIGGHGPYNPAPVEQTEQTESTDLVDPPKGKPKPAEEPTNTDFPTKSE